MGIDPWKSPDYLGNVNRLQANALDASTEAGKQELEDQNRRTGGLNTSATNYGMRDLDLKKMRLADQLSSQRAAQDFDKNQAWQQFLLQSTLAPASTETSFYGTGTQGQSAANKNLTDLGLASYGPWNAAIAAAGGAASGALQKGK